MDLQKFRGYFWVLGLSVKVIYIVPDVLYVWLGKQNILVSINIDAGVMPQDYCYIYVY